MTDNVVYHSFGKPKAPDATSGTAPDGERVIQSKKWFEEKPEVLETETGTEDRGVVDLLPLAIRIQLHLRSLRGHITRSTIDSHRATLATNTLVEIYDLIKGTDTLEWSAKPAFYTAVVEEMLRRIREFEGE